MKIISTTATFKGKNMDELTDTEDTGWSLSNETQTWLSTVAGRGREREGGKPKQMDRWVISGREDMEVLQRCEEAEKEGKEQVQAKRS